MDAADVLIQSVARVIGQWHLKIASGMQPHSIEELAKRYLRHQRTFHHARLLPPREMRFRNYWLAMLVRAIAQEASYQRHTNRDLPERARPWIDRRQTYR